MELVISNTPLSKPGRVRRRLHLVAPRSSPGTSVASSILGQFAPLQESHRPDDQDADRLSANAPAPDSATRSGCLASAKYLSPYRVVVSTRRKGATRGCDLQLP